MRKRCHKADQCKPCQALLAVHELVDVLRVGGVTAEEAMVAEDPEVTWLGGWFFRCLGYVVWVSVAFFWFEFGNG